LIRYSDNGSTLSAVNFPEVVLPPHPGSHRLLHIHRNVPGVLSQINAVFSQKHINIAAQYLQTNPEIGYVVMDIDEEHSQTALEELKRVDGTIRTRVLCGEALRPPHPHAPPHLPSRVGARVKSRPCRAVRSHVA